MPLKLKVKRNGKVIGIVASFRIVPINNTPNATATSCQDQEARYKSFKLDYKGHNLCAYTSAKFPRKLVLRIRSFVYFPEDSITDLNAEVEMFWFNYWRKQSHLFKELIIDVIGNRGGQSPIPYYALFTTAAFQEQYTQFKKTKELERKDIYDSLFWGDKGKEIWMDELKSNGQYARVKEGEFFAPVPQFCADRTQSCLVGNFKTKPHRFRGKIKLLVDQWCISSCVGFVDNMKKLFKGRLKIFGHEDSADSAYGRLTLAMSIHRKSDNIEVLPLSKAKNPDQPVPWISQVVAVTRSTDRDGNILTGKPQNVDHWVPRKWDQDLDEWSKVVFNTALNKK